MNITPLLLIFFALLLIILMKYGCNSNQSNLITGGKRIRKHELEVWDDECLEDHEELDDLLYDYERRTVGRKLRSFLKWYRPMISSRCIMNYLLKNKFSMYAVKLRTHGGYIDIHGNTTRKTSRIAPHFIFIHKDHSCVRLKPIVGGERRSYTPFPTISFAIVYDSKGKSNFNNESFKVTRYGEAFPKAGLNNDHACMNPNLSEFQIDKVMQTTHIKVPKSSTTDLNYFMKFELDD